jgi:GTP cyclohydrolase I
MIPQEYITGLIKFIGDDPDREGLINTPERVIKAYWNELFVGYGQNPEDLLTTFDGEGCDQIIISKGIELYSMCEHHILPFFGVAHVAYIPNDRVIGISKLARLVDLYARRLQIQERIGEQVTGALMEFLQPKGAACIIEATHMCMRMRGVSKQGATMVTSSMKGAFYNDEKARAELMALIRI